MLIFVPNLLVLSHFINAKKINPTSALCTFLYWRSTAAYFSVKFRKYTAKKTIARNENAFFHLKTQFLFTHLI